MIPADAKIYFNDENYFLKQEGPGTFSYTFSNLKEPLSFYLAANGVRSRDYQIEVLKTPTVVNFEMFVDYPNYTKKRDELIKNTGNAILPEGTRVTWNINAQQTDTITWSLQGQKMERELLNMVSKNNFSIVKRIRNNTAYQITTSNAGLRDYEKLNYTIQVVKDEYPKINVKSDVDSVARGPIQFAGQLSDDYGLSKLNLVYYTTKQPETLHKRVIAINTSSFEEFYYVFDPQGELNLEMGTGYEIYFEAFDNDAVNGNKSVKSQVFKYHNKNKQEISEDLLKEQKESLEELNETTKQTEKLNKDFDDFTNKLKNKSELNWNDKKEVEQFLKRQEQYQEMFDKQTDKLKENLDEQNENESGETIKEKKEELKKRIDETKEMQDKERLLEELKKMADKLDKEGMLDKLDKLTKQNKQEKRSLERLLELTKRFYVEKKTDEVVTKLDSLSEKQERLAQDSLNNVAKQEELNKEFDAIQKELEELKKQNEELKMPMDLPDTKRDEQKVEDLMKEATEELQVEDLNPETDKNEKSAPKKQKSAAKKMKEMSESMKGAMLEMEGEMLDENIEDLRAIVENLVTFSFDQEQLMVSLEGVDAEHPTYPKKLKQQQVLKEYFEHIDDSLYTLSLRLQQLSASIQKDITDAHYNIDKSLENIAENRMRQGISNQQYTMTAANNLADVLSDMLNSMQNPSMGKGQGKDSNLPDIIKKQQGLGEKMKQGMKDGKEKGDKEGKGSEGEQMTGEQYEIYKEQQALRESLEELIKKAGKEGKSGTKALEKMKELEQQLLDKGFDNQVLQKMMEMEHELLKLDKATFEQGEDSKRTSETNRTEFQQRLIDRLQLNKLFFNPDEILNRQPLPLRNSYKKKVQTYFNEKI